MKNIKIKYNPYLITTDITVDGQKPKANSALNLVNRRLQEWVGELPTILLEEYRDSNVHIDFTGTLSDFEDVKGVFNDTNKISATFRHNQTADITDVEKQIDEIFSDIQKGPIPELRSSEIEAAFNKAKNSEFEVSVVATMSSGKSTLINALLQKQLMPAANEATTATIVRIIDTEQEDFSATAYNKDGDIVEQIKEVSLEHMKRLNDSAKVFAVDIKGKVPFVKSVGMKLVLVDTPGPNNSRDTRHQDMTHEMIRNSDKSLVLYVMNGQQLAINDEKVFLDYVCEKMKEGGKQGRERFIFAVNKMDAFKPKDEGLDCIERALTNVKQGLESRGIYNPNIFPVSAAAALELRTEDDEPMALDVFKRGIKKYKELHFDEYYQYSNLPQPARLRIENLLKEADEDGVVEVHTGIVSIEQAIAQYVNKYARTMKIKDLVQSFNGTLKEQGTLAKIQKNIKDGQISKEKLETEIRKINAYIQDGRNTKDRSANIDKIDLTSFIETKIKGYMEGTRNKLNRMMTGRSNKVEKSVARNQCSVLEKECQSIASQIKVEIERILQDTYKETISKTIEEYKRHLSKLNLGENMGDLTFSPISLVSGSLANLSSIVDSNSKSVDEGRYVQKTESVFVPSKIKWYNPFTWFNEGDHYEERHYNEWESKYVTYVDMNEVASDFITPLLKQLREMQNAAINHVNRETERLKEHLKLEFSKIDHVIEEKLKILSKTEADVRNKSNEIAIMEEKFRWLEKIQQRVNNIIEF